MRKIFFLIPALILAMMVNATPLGPSDPNVTVTDVIKTAVADASADAVIELSDGIYEEEGNFAINKNITIKAAEGAHPVIAQRYYIKIEGGASVTFEGIKFDGGAYGGTVGAYDYSLRSHNSSTGAEILTLEDCEFTNYPSHVIFAEKSTRKMGSIIVRNCYFHNNTKSAINIGYDGTAQACNSLTVENSTFAGSGENVIIFAGSGDLTYTTSLNVNHCTFYNLTKRAVYWEKSSNLTVTNCIFAQPASSSYKSVECVGGTITNCLTYNTAGYSSAATQEGCLTGNPYFVNTSADNYDFTPASFSQAHNAGTDSKNLGALTWTSDDSAHPTTMNITAVDANSLTAAVEKAWPGDTIVLANGTYSEDEVIVFDKSLVIKAAAEAHPVIAQHYYSKVTSGADVQFIGIKFDGSIYPANDYCFYPFDNTAGNELHFEKCEFVGFNNYVLYNGGAYSLDSLIVNNCFFHNNNKSSVIYFEKHSSEGSQTVKGVKVTNSTFANNYTSPSYSVIFVRNQTGTTLSDVEVTVDHCTFYNNTTTNTDHSAVRSYKSTKVNVTNCIFAHPEPVNLPATSCYGGTISNNLSYNFNNYGSYYGHRQSTGQPVLSNNIKGNPVFKDPTNNDFTLLNASSARRLGTIYGDPRWIQDIQPVAIPATLLPADAILSDSASVISATPDSIDFKYVSSRKYTDLEWAKWMVTVAKDGFYNFTAHTYRNDAQQFEIKLFDANESVVLKENTDDNMSSGDRTISTGNVYLAAGNTYVIKVRNIYNWSDSKLVKVVASYEGGIPVAIPDTLWPVDAMRSERAFVEEDSLHFTKDDQAGHIHGQWGKWNISVAEAGKYKFTANTYSTNGQNYRITLKDENESTTIGTWYGEDDDSGKRKIVTEMVDLTIGNYVLMIEDTVKYSHGRVANIVASYEGGKTVNVPGLILAKEAVIGKVDGGHTPIVSHLMENGDLKYDNNGNNMEEFATWTLNVTEATEMVVTLDVPHIPGKGHIFSLELYQGNTRLDSIGEIFEGDSKTTWAHGEITLPDHLTFPAIGTYTLKLWNNQAHSGGALHAITFAEYVTPPAPTVVSMYDTDTDNSAWIGNLNETVDVTVERTILAGMWNTICLPFTVNSTKCKAVFGSDVELYTLGSAEISGDILNLNFDVADDIWHSTPIMIKTSTNIVNPTFEGVLIDKQAASSTPKNAANFVGSFVAQTFHAGDQVLLLMSNNVLAFPQSDKTLKGFRAYFSINNTNGAPIRAARIVTPNQVPTEIDLVNTENNDMLKTIENGQLIIIKNGVRYNALGVKLQ